MTDTLPDTLPPNTLADELPPEIQVEPVEQPKTEVSEEDHDEEESPRRRRPGKTQRQVMRLEDEIRALREEIRQTHQVKPTPVVPEAVRPSPDKFDDHDAYLEALADWKAEQKIGQLMAQREQEEQQRRQRESAESRNTTVARRIEAGRNEFDDFDDVVTRNPDLRITEGMVEIIAESEIGHKLAYHLGRHPQEAARIAALPDRAQARELGMLEAKLSTPTPRKTTAAPEPIRPVGNNEPVVKDLSKASYEEYKRIRMGG